MTGARGKDDSETADAGEPDGSDTGQGSDPARTNRNGSDSKAGQSGNERTDGENDEKPTRSGRRVIEVVFVGCVLLAGGFGYFIGGIGLRALGSISVFGLTVFEPTPVGMAFYGMTVTGLVLGVLYVGARFALRRESEAKQPSRGR